MDGGAGDDELWGGYGVTHSWRRGETMYFIVMARLRLDGGEGYDRVVAI